MRIELANLYEAAGYPEDVYDAREIGEADIDWAGELAAADAEAEEEWEARRDEERCEWAMRNPPPLCPPKGYPLYLHYW